MRQQHLEPRSTCIATELGPKHSVLLLEEQQGQSTMSSMAQLEVWELVAAKQVMITLEFLEPRTRSADEDCWHCSGRGPPGTAALATLPGCGQATLQELMPKKSTAPQSSLVFPGRGVVMHRQRPVDRRS